MRLQIVSDLHLEFGPIEILNAGDTDVLILSGDICLASEFDKGIRTFFQKCSEEFRDVIYIMGNHEHYSGDFALSATLLREGLEEFTNIHFMEKNTITIKDYTFIGATLWTDMNKNDPNTLWHVGRVMNDFRTVRNGEKGKLKPADVYEEHLSTLEYIRSVVDKDPMQKYVVVGHHAPSKQSIKPHYRGDHLVNGAYSSDLSEFILDRPQIKLWTHGHTHDNFDYMVGTTRVLCNPRGYYNYEENDNFDPNMVVELE